MGKMATLSHIYSWSRKRIFSGKATKMSFQCSLQKTYLSFIQNKCISFKRDPVKSIMTILCSTLAIRAFILSKFTLSVFFHVPNLGEFMMLMKLRSKLPNCRGWFLNHYCNGMLRSHGTTNGMRLLRKHHLLKTGSASLLLVSLSPHYSIDIFL